MELLIFISSCGPNINYENILDTIFSISKNIGIKNYGFYYVTDKSEISDRVLKIFKELNLVDKIIELIVSTHSWANNFNMFFEKYRDKTNYFCYSHDDLVVTTENFYNLTLQEIEKTEEKVGWITYTNDFYYLQKGLTISNSVREGFSVDRFKSPQVFECSLVSPNEQFDNRKLNYPKQTVKCHAPFSHFCLISNDSMKKIGHCSDWSRYTLLIDEDWGLESLKKRTNNIWIPNIFYTHPLRYQDRKEKDIRYQSEVHKEFYKKWEWNFNFGNYNDSYIEYICNKYKNTNLNITKDKYTYDWQYLREK